MLDEEGGTRRKEGRGGRRDAEGRIFGLTGPCSQISPFDSMCSLYQDEWKVQHQAVLPDISEKHHYNFSDLYSLVNVVPAINNKVF